MMSVTEKKHHVSLHLVPSLHQSPIFTPPLLPIPLLEARLAAFSMLSWGVGGGGVGSGGRGVEQEWGRAGEWRGESGQWLQVRYHVPADGSSACICSQQQCSTGRSLRPSHPMATDGMVMQLSEDHNSYSGRHHDVIVSQKSMISV